MVHVSNSRNGCPTIACIMRDSPEFAPTRTLATLFENEKWLGRSDGKARPYPQPSRSMVLSHLAGSLELVITRRLMIQTARSVGFFGYAYAVLELRKRKPQRCRLL